MNFLSVCAGIEAASVAWHPLGWKAVAFSEIEKFPSAVLAHHYPDTPNLGDMTKHNEWPTITPDLLVGGTPCQAFSVAGLREGLNDPRGNLTLTFLAMAAKYRPKWVVWENVPGVLSDRTNAFGNLLAGLAELGYGWSYRVLDAQYFGVAQRRKRVFVVACLGDWQRAASVLFEPESLSGNPPPSREARKDVAPTLAARTQGGGGLGTDFDCDGGCIPIQEPGKRTGKSTNDRQHGSGLGEDGDPMFTLQAGATHGVAHTLKGEGFDASEDGTGRGTPIVPVKWPAKIAPTLNASFGEKQGLEDQHALGGGGFLSHARCLTAKSQRNDWETETLIPTGQGGFFDARTERFLCRNCGRKFGVDDYPRNPTCPDCTCMTVDDLLQGHSFPEGTKLAFAELGSPNNPEPIAFSSKDHGADAGAVSPTLRSVGGYGANGGGPPAIAFHPTQDPISSTDGSIHALGCGSKGGTATGAVAIGFQDDTTPKTSEERIGALRADAGGEGACVAFQSSQSGVRTGDVHATLDSNNGSRRHNGAVVGMSVRRLTPTECERLQGFPDGYTNIPWRGKQESPDGPRYKALGNSMAVPVMAWIGRRIAAVDATPTLESMEVE